MSVEGVAPEPEDEQSPVAPTRREGSADPVAPTRREGQEPPAPTRRDSGGLPRDQGLIGLPSDLRDEYEIVSALPNPGSEADVLLVRDGRGGLWVVKVYRLGIRADATIWNALKQLTGGGTIEDGLANVVRIVRTGTSDGRDYEVMEYLEGGNLTTLLIEQRPLPVDTVRSLAMQIAAGLRALHSAKIVHRDLKPENVLIAASQGPLRIRIADFGLARLTEMSIAQASRSGTLAYLPPEAWLPAGAEMSNKWDWWSLGILVLELATGHRALANLSDAVVQKTTLIHGIDVSEVSDPRLRVLCRGLLTRRPDKRWGADEISRWAAGATPEVFEGIESDSETIAAFKFNHAEIRSREALARAFQNDWPEAVRRFFVAMGSLDNPSVAWRQLRGWLLQFADNDSVDQDAFEELLDVELASGIGPDVKLIKLVHWLDPRLAVHYRGLELTKTLLGDLSRTLAGGLGRDGRDGQDPVAVEFFRVLVRPGVLSAVSQLPGYEWAVGMEGAFVSHQHRERQYREEVGRYLPMRFPDDGLSVSGALLWAAADEAQARNRLTGRLVDRQRQLPQPVAWFDSIGTQQAGYAGAVLALRLFPLALAESMGRQREIDQTHAEQMQRQQQWDQLERQRLDGAAGAQALALRALIPMLVLIAAIFVLGIGAVASTRASASSLGPGTSTWGVIIAWLVINGASSVISAMYLVISEMRFAERLGQAYAGRTRFSGSGGVLRGAVGGIGPGVGCLLLALVPLAAGVAVSLPLIPDIVFAVMHRSSLRERRSAWESFHQFNEHQILEGSRR